MISKIDGKIAIDYRTIHQDQPKDLSRLQRLLVFKKCGKAQDPIPERTGLEV